MTVTSKERAELCDLFDEMGPDAPTLCGDWTTLDLLAHLLVRERRPDAAGGILIPALAGRTERVMQSVESSKPYAALVDQLREGPPFWSPWAIPVLGDRGNTAEFFIHHEDVRRAQPDWQARAEDADLEQAMFGLLKLMGRVLYRKAPGGVVAKVTGHETLTLRKGEDPVVLVGLASEIVMHAFGRPPSVVHVVFQGDPDTIAAFEAAPRGM